jgi:hypothetical protein
MISKEKAFKILNVIILGLIIGMMFFVCKKSDHTKELVDGVEAIDSTNTYSKVYYDTEISNLKKKNKELYDSLQANRDKVSYLLQFKYQKEYTTGVVHVKDKNQASTEQTTIPTIEEKDSTYTYSSVPNDTMMYKLQVNSSREPNWYSLNVKMSDRFTIVNKSDDNGLNVITIDPQNNGSISDVTTFKKKQKKTFFQHFHVGPSVTAGYDPINKQWGVMIGVGVTIR